MPDCMAATVTLPTWALTLPRVQAVLAEEPAHETETLPDGTTQLVQIDAPWGEWPALEEALVQAHIAFDRHSDAKYEYDAETRYFRPATATESGCDVVVPTLYDGEPVIRLADVTTLAEAGPLTLDRIRAALGVPPVSVAAWAAAHAPRDSG